MKNTWNIFTLILKNYIISFKDEMSFNSSHSSIITLCGLKLSFKSKSEISSFLYYFDVDALDNR